MSSSSKVIIEDSALEILKVAVFSGTKYIDSTSEVDAVGYSNARVSKADTIIPENIKKDVSVLGVTGSYDGESKNIKFDTVAYTYSEAESFLEGHHYQYQISLDAYPFFYFTNISQQLEQNQFYCISSRDPRSEESYYNVGQIVTDNSVEEIKPNRMVLGYYSEESSVYKLDCMDNIDTDTITLYIAEKISDEEVLIAAKGSSKLNALYPFTLGVAKTDAAQEDDSDNVIEVLHNGQVIETLYPEEKDATTRTTRYNTEYQLKAYKRNHNNISVWGILEDDVHSYDNIINYQYPTIFKSNEFPSSSEYTSVWYIYNEDVRNLSKAGLPFIILCNDKITEDKLVYGSHITLITNEPEIEGKHIVFQVYNSSTEQITELYAEHHDKEGSYWDYDGYLTEGLEGDPNTSITITCIQEDYKSGIYNKGNSDFNFELRDGHGDSVAEGSVLYGSNQYRVHLVEDGSFPVGTRVFVNSNLAVTSTYPTNGIDFMLEDNYISNNEVVISVKNPITAEIVINNTDGSQTIIIQSASAGGSRWECPTGKTTTLNVPLGNYYIGANSLVYKGTLLSGSVYHGNAIENSIVMDKHQVIMIGYMMYSNQVGVTDTFNLVENDSLTFKIETPVADYIKIDNTNGTSDVTINSYHAPITRTITVNAGSTYNLSADQYMIIRDNYTIAVQSETTAQWLAKDSTNPIDLTVSGKIVLNPQNENHWFVSYTNYDGYQGTIILTGAKK